MEGDPQNMVNLAELFKKKKGILFGVPGAFSPNCHRSHLPSYLQKADTIRKMGIDLIVCVAVNDTFVMSAWAKTMKTEGKVRMLADPMGKVPKALDLVFDSEQILSVMGYPRCKRFVMVVEDGEVKGVNVEPDGRGLSCSLAPDVIKMLDRLK